MVLRFLCGVVLLATACGGLSEEQVRERVFEATGSSVLLEREGDDLWLHFASPVRGLSVRASADPDVAPHAEPVGRLDAGTRLELEGLAATGRRFLTLQGPGRQPLTVAERRLQIEGAPNFRDLGGYETGDGRTVAWGRVYRSGALAELTPEGVDRLGELGIPLVCDLRSDAEAAEAPSRLPAPSGGDGPQVLRLPILVPEVDPTRLRERIESGDVRGLDAAFMERAYVSMLEHHAQTFGQALLHIARAEGPTLVHCTAGKDRTGLVSALLLLVLGVPQETVLGDYVLSEIYDWRAIRRASLYLLYKGIEPPTMRPLIGTDPAVLEGALSWLREEHGSIEAYLTGAAGLTPEDLVALETRLLRGEPRLPGR